MNRDIKFDVILWEPGDPDSVSHYNIGDAIGEDFIDFTDGVMKPQDDSVIMRQFTGLKDKNGKEIYEGDILHYIYYVEHGQWGEHKDGGNAQVKWDEGKTGFTPIVYWTEYDEQLSRCKVIGNIFENPELLK